MVGVKAIRTSHEVLAMTFQNIHMATFCSSSKAKTTSIAAKYPMSSPLVLKLWDTFETDVLELASSIPNVSLFENFVPNRPQKCSGEFGVQSVADYILFDPLQILIKTLCANFDYLKEGSFTNIEGRNIICDPDRIWITEPFKLAKISIEFKPPWAFKAQDIIAAYNSESHSFFVVQSVKSKGKIMCAIEQIYVYMTINRHRYGCLSTFDQTWFLKKVEDESNPNNSLLYITPVISCSSNKPYTITSAWLYILMTIEKNMNWLYSSPRSSLVCAPSFAAGEKSFDKDRYKPISLDGLIHWENIIARSQAGAVATGRFMNLENVVFKTIDISKRKDGLSQFNNEVSVYQQLEEIQSNCIPRLIAYGNLGGLLQVIILENVGSSITREKAIEKQYEIDEALRQIHAKGIVHNDLRLPNILINSEDKISIIDFGMSLSLEGEIVEKFQIIESDIEM